jgi:Glyoxalase-like domain
MPDERPGCHGCNIRFPPGGDRRRWVRRPVRGPEAGAGAVASDLDRPTPAYPQQFHLDVTVDDVDAAEAAVLELGATSLSSSVANWRVYADPAGKPFCFCWD